MMHGSNNGKEVDGCTHREARHGDHPSFVTRAPFRLSLMLAIINSGPREDAGVIRRQAVDISPLIMRTVYQAMIYLLTAGARESAFREQMKTINTELAIHALDQVHCWDAYFRLRIGHFENFTPLNFQPLLFSKQWRFVDRRCTLEPLVAKKIMYKVPYSLKAV
jgi:hypothetical protein